MPEEFLLPRIDNGERCITARDNENRRCWDGGDEGRKTALKDAETARKVCYDELNTRKCDCGIYTCSDSTYSDRTRATDRLELIEHLLAQRQHGACREIDRRDGRDKRDVTDRSAPRPVAGRIRGSRTSAHGVQRAEALPMRHHVYFSPGMFGFGKLGSYTYFSHVERELTARFAAAGQELCAHVIEDLPTASIRRRSTRLAEVVQRTATGSDPIHLLGHSTGGLDARLVASPSTTSIPADVLGWLPRLRTVTTMNTPHYGTPLASFFATSNGQRVLAALSMLTVAGLTLGATPLRATSVVLGFLQRGDLAIPFKLLMLDRAVQSVVAMVDDAGSPEVRSFLAAIEDDQGSMLQLSPESMDLVVAGFEDRSGVRYQATASMSPAPTPRRWAETVGHPVRALSLSIFYALHRITSNADKRYPCHAHDGAPAGLRAKYDAQVTAALGRVPTVADNDGVVPFRSQLWGTLVWSGLGDHLDVLGHYRGDRDDGPRDGRHHDWLTSGSEFSNAQFATLMDAVATGMLA